jgi:hypothetical protein
MSCSPARLEANRRNALLSSGPKTEEGKARSRANALKHCLTGAGVVLPDEDVARIEERLAEFESDLKPVNGVGRFLARRAAMLSVRLERCVRNESAAIASRMRRAEADFDHDRLAEVDQAYSYIVKEPATYARKLGSMPEGIDPIIRCLLDIQEELLLVDGGRWDWSCADRISNLMGVGWMEVPVTRVRALAEAISGNFADLLQGDGDELDAKARIDWARLRMADLIGEEVEALREVLETLDPSAVEADRAGASARAIFDPSKEAILARKYEAAAERGLFRTLREIREVGTGPTADLGLPIEPTPGEEPEVGPSEGPGAPPAVEPMGSFFPEVADRSPLPGKASGPGAGPVPAGRIDPNTC